MYVSKVLLCIKGRMIIGNFFLFIVILIKVSILGWLKFFMIRVLLRKEFMLFVFVFR